MTTPRHGEGTQTEITRATRIAQAIADHYNESIADFFVAGHKHEELSKGSVSVAWEGYVYSWTIEWPETETAQKLAHEMGVWFEPVNSCILAVHPR